MRLCRLGNGTARTHDRDVVLHKQSGFLATLLQDAQGLGMRAALQADAIDAQQPVPRPDGAFPGRRAQCEPLESEVSSRTASLKAYRVWLQPGVVDKTTFEFYKEAGCWRLNLRIQLHACAQAGQRSVSPKVYLT